jgi:AcrR family transcriptional regulator
MTHLAASPAMRSELRKHQIQDRARKLFARQGFHATTVTDIVREAGVARGTFYRHFEGKRDVFEQLLEGLFASLALDIRRVDLTEGQPPVMDQMLGNVQRVLRTLFENADITRILLREAVGIDDDFDRKIDEFYGRILSLIMLSLRHGQEMGIVRRCDTQLAALMVLGSVKQVLDWAIASRRPQPFGPDVARELLALVAGGLLVLGASPRTGEENDEH